MKEINIGKAILTKRKEKEMTQDELASYMGVSKASVSKWETGQSYPDITFLPQLATYFNITIDELMGYSPQMTKEDIQKLYHRLAAAFATEPFHEVLARCKNIIKEYYSCFPLLLQMVVLLMNHHMLSEDEKEQKTILKQAVELCIKVKTESDDVWISKEAVSLEGVCYLMLQQPQDVLDLFGESIRPMSVDSEKIAQAYQIMGNITRAKEVTQINMYQHLMAFFGATPSYLMLYADDLERIEEILKRIMSLASSFQLDKLHPNMLLQIYYAATQVYCMHNDKERALGMLEQYTNTCTNGFFPYTLHGDSYFDLIEDWFQEFDLGTSAVRSEKTVRESMLQGVTANPAFACLAEEKRYQRIIEKLKENLNSEEG